MKVDIPLKQSMLSKPIKIYLPMSIIVWVTHSDFVPDVLKCNIVVVREFILLLYNYVHFRITTFGKVMNTLTLSSYGLDSTSTILQGWIWYKITLQAKVEMGVMAMKGYSTFLKVLNYQNLDIRLFSVINRTLLEGFYNSIVMQSVYSTLLADWAN